MTAFSSDFFFEGLEEAAAAGVDIPVPRVTNATPISHSIVAAATASLIRFDPICMVSPFLGPHVTRLRPGARAFA
jgi:hypothetical protein